MTGFTYEEDSIDLIDYTCTDFSCGTSDRRPGDSPLTTEGNIGDMVLMYYGGVHRKRHGIMTSA